MLMLTGHSPPPQLSTMRKLARQPIPFRASRPLEKCGAARTVVRELSRVSGGRNGAASDCFAVIDDHVFAVRRYNCRATRPKPPDCRQPLVQHGAKPPGPGVFDC